MAEISNYLSAILSFTAQVVKWVPRATAALVGFGMVALPLAYGYRKAMHFLETDEHLFVAVVLVGLAGLGARLVLAGGQQPLYGSWVQVWGLVLVASTVLLHTLAGVPNSSRIVLLLLLSLAWPSVAASVLYSRYRPWLMGVVGVAVLGQSGLAGYQFLSADYQSLAARGTLFNAGILGNYLALALPWLLGVTMETYRTARGQASSNRFSYVFYLATTLLAAGALTLTGARAAWLGSLAGAGVVVGREWARPLAGRIRHWWAGQAGRRLGSLVLLSGVGGVGLWALIQLKVASVYGRWQIYTIGLEMFNQHPVLGIGWGQVASQFNEQQANYFATHTVPVARQLLATDTYLLFNSLLQLGVEAGAAGVAAWLAGCGFLWATVRRSYREAWPPAAVGAAGALVSVGVSSLFSYPFQVLPVAALAGLMLAWLPTTQPRKWTAGGRRGRVVGVRALILLISGVGYQEGQRWRALQRWQRAAVLAQQQQFEQAAPLYEQARTVLAQHGAFLYNYGVEAGFAGQATRSLGLLEATRPYYTSSALYSYLGQAYEDTGQPQRAAWCYQHASNIVPAYFYPRYQLFELYRTTGQQRQAYRVGQRILAYPIKIDTDLTRQIKYRVAQVLQGSH